MKDGSKEAFGELYNRYKGVLYAHSYKMLQNREEVRDLLQEVFLKLWVKREELLIRNISAYLYSSVRNSVIDRISHSKIKEKYINSFSFFDEHNNYDLPDRQLHLKELRELIEAEVANLPPKMRQIFEMSRKLHMSHKEIGDELGISEFTVKKQVNNSLKILRSKFNNYNTFLFFLFIYSLA